MKILVYGMQSSGASLITYFLAQNKNMLAIVDLWDSVKQIPKLDESIAKEIIIKFQIISESHQQKLMSRYQPTKKILVLRHPYYNYVSLRKKHYKDGGGHIDDKFKVLEQAYVDRNKFDLVIYYEDFILHPLKVLKKLEKSGLVVEKSFFRFGS